MGLTYNILAFQDKVLKIINLKWKDVRMCELGDQIFYKSHIVAKKYYTEIKKVLEHVSLDLNGMFGSLVVDLNFPVPESLIDRFQLITDYGTSEHVENQFQVFKNVHDMCKANGIMIHTLPLPNNFPDHCLYYYPKEFFSRLARLCDYKVIMLKIQNAFNPPIPKSRMIFVAFFKKKSSEFISKKQFDELNIFAARTLPQNKKYYIREKGIRQLWSIWYLFEMIIPKIGFLNRIYERAYGIYFTFFSRRAL